MLVSWDWLGQYVQLDMSPDELAERLMMAGLNHEATLPHGRDLAINLEVTSNRPDCLGHIGVAREVAVLWKRPLQLPKAEPRAGFSRVDELAQVRIDCPQLCPRYTARVLRGVQRQIQSRLACRSAGDDWHSGDQQRGRHYQLRADGMWAAAACV